jgi:hypothetical protein
MSKYLFAISFILLFSCKKIKEYEQKVELEPLQQGLKTSAALGYCASVALDAFTGKELPSNVLFVKNTGLIYVKVDKEHPLPFNNAVGDIVIAGLWQNNCGLISVLLSKIDILGGDVKLYGFYTIPVIKNRDNDDALITVFARQDIVVGNGSDTILRLGDITQTVFNAEMDRVNSAKPTDAFVVVKQNVWYIDVKQNNTPANLYDDDITVNGGGQIAEIKGTTGGVMYHAMINTNINFNECSINPVDGFALIQNFKAGGELFVDLGNSFMSFHNNCDGKLHVDFCSGKYLSSNGKNISLNLK